MDACHRAAKLFTVWGTGEVTTGIKWNRCVIGPPPSAWLLFRLSAPAAWESFNQAATWEVCKVARSGCLRLREDWAKAPGSTQYYYRLYVYNIRLLFK